MRVSYNPAAAGIANLFQITNLKLSRRPGDPYKRAVDILKSLRFSDLSITFNRRSLPTGPLIAGNSSRSPWPLGCAIPLIPRAFGLASDGGTDRSYALGARLTLSWPIVSPVATETREGATAMSTYSQSKRCSASCSQASSWSIRAFP